MLILVQCTTLRAVLVCCTIVLLVLGYSWMICLYAVIVSVGTRFMGCESLDGVFRGPVRSYFFANSTMQLVQAPYHCHPDSFTKGAAT